MRRFRPEEGSALVEVTWLALLLMVPLVYIVLAVFEVQRSAFAVSAAARSAGRAYSMAPDQTTALERAYVAAEVALRDQDVDVDRSDIVIGCEPDPAGCLAPGSVITVAIRHRDALPLMPAALGNSSPTFVVEAAHRVPYGTFRERRP